MLKKSLIVFFVVFTLSTQYTVTTQNDVYTLNDNNFNDFKNDSDHLFVLFTSSDCQNCASVIPEFVMAAKEFQNTQVKVGIYDSSNQNGIVKQLNIRSFPTILFFQKNKAYIRYLGVRNKESFINYLRKNTTQKLRELKNKEEVQSIIDDIRGDEFIVIHFGEKNLSQFMWNIEKIDNVIFAYCIAIDCLSNYKVSNGSVIIFKSFDNNKQIKINTGYSIEKLISVIEKEGTPSFVDLDEKYLDLIIKKKKPALMLFYNQNNKDKYIEFASTLGLKLKGIIQVIYSGYNQKLVDSKLIDYFQIKGEDKKLPFISILDSRGPRPKFIKYSNSELDERKILRFVKDWENNTLKYEKVSEKIPLTQKGYVKKLVSLNFEDQTKQSTGNILVRYYDSNNEDKTESKLFYSLASKFQDKMEFGQIDLAKNDIYLVIKKLPTYHLWQGNNKKYVEYKLDLSEENLVKFINEYIIKADVLIKDDL
jgi:thiol-disulfide isomerase/thioredoxin